VFYEELRSWKFAIVLHKIPRPALANSRLVLRVSSLCWELLMAELRITFFIPFTSQYYLSLHALRAFLMLIIKTNITTDAVVKHYSSHNKLDEKFCVHFPKIAPQI
jgi:hypothetical protein